MLIPFFFASSSTLKEYFRIPTVHIGKFYDLPFQYLFVSCTLVSPNESDSLSVDLKCHVFNSITLTDQSFHGVIPR